MYPIPANATRIRYLESTGTQYIDTGIVPTGATKVRCVFSLDNLNNFSPVFWSRGSSSTDKAFCFEGENKGQARWDYGNYGPLQVANALVAGQRYTVEVNSGTLSVAESTLQRTEQTFTGAGSIILFNFCNYVNGERQMLSAARQPVRIYGFTIYDGTTLVRSFVPVRVGTVGYLFDRVSGQLFGNAGTGDFVLGPDVFKQGVVPTRMMVGGVMKKPLLPSQYVELEFVNTNGDTVSGDAKKVNSSAAFNTGFTPTASTVVETIICPGNNGTGAWETFIGGSKSGDTESGSWLLRRVAANAQICFTVNAWTGQYTKVNVVNESSWCKLRISITSIYSDVDGVTKTETVPNSSSFTGVAPIWIGAAGRSTYGNSYRGCKALIGRTTITDNGAVVRDYVPAMRKADSVCGFYDLVSGTFKTSEVTGHSFTSNGYST